MATLFVPRFYHQRRPEPTFRGLFRLLDEFDQYSSQASPRSRQVQNFAPRFDVKETEATYELHGELPGVEKDNISIEFSDPQTIVIRGRTERTYTAGNAPAAVEAQPEEPKAALTEAAPEADSDEPVVVEHEHASETSSVKSYQATVEDEVEEGTAAPSEVQPTPATTVAEPAKPAAEESKPEPATPKSRYWVSERSVGQFARSFQFPTRVEYEAVSATLKNGILVVTVPKAKKHESKRIAIF